MTPISPAPKPERAPPQKPQFSSIVDRRSIPEKLAALQKLRGHSPLKRTTKKKIQFRNPKVAARKSASYRKGLAAYRKSTAFKEVELRAQGRCERVTRWLNEDGVKVPMRCTNTRDDGKLIHNHLTYRRFGGKELASDIELLCQAHNAEYETAKRPWNRKRIFGGAGPETGKTT